MNDNYYYYLIALIGTLIESSSDIAFKKFVNTNNKLYMFAGLIGYVLTGFAFMQLLYLHNLGTSNIIWHVIHFIILSLTSIFYFNEKYNFTDLIGIAFGILSFIILSRKHHH